MAADEGKVWTGGTSDGPNDKDALVWCMWDSFLIAAFLIVIEFVEVANLDKIMVTKNSVGHKSKKSAAACESESDDDGLSSDESSEEDDYPDWRLMLKNVEGNHQLFWRDKLQLKINDIEKKVDLRCAESCFEFDTGAEKEYDPRLVRSFPTSPREYADFEGCDFGNFGKLFDNVYAESKAPAAPDAMKTYSEMGTQA